jgi:hydroxyethylthiazole kinase-like sugar kinase family protein
VFKRAGEVSETRAGRNPASFRLELINAIHNIDRFLTVSGKVRVIKS